MNSRSSRARWLGLPMWIAISFLPAITGALVDTGSWYESLRAPGWTPPSWVFGPVWTTLYLAMGVAAWRVWCTRTSAGRPARIALAVFLVHLALNAAWTWLFFGLHLLGAAAIEIVVLWAMILALVVLFWRLDRWAGALLVPYLLWVTYAATLSIGFAVMN